MKVFGKILAAVLCVVALMTVAFAAETTFAPTADGTYSIPYTEGAEGSYYALLVVKGVYTEGQTPEISEDTVLYIDQATADANGDVSFDGWLPKNEEPATVYLGSNQAGFEGPVLLGYLGQSKFVVAGTVTTDSATSYEATVTLTNADGTFTATSASGAYSVEVPEGTYTFTVNVKNHLSYTDTDFAVAGDVSGKNVTVKSGDIDGDGVINEMDLGKVSTNYGSSDGEYDINGDGTTNELDLGKVSTNYGEVAVAE